MIDGKVALVENKFPKTWKIYIEGTLDGLRIRNQANLLAFQSIYSIDVSSKNAKQPCVKIKTANGNVYFTHLNSFKNPEATWKVD